MPLGKVLGLGPGHTVLDGNQWGPSPHNSPFPGSSHAYCGQTVAHLSNCWALVILLVFVRWLLNSILERWWYL